MLRRLKEVIGHTLDANDGEIGRCNDFLFDDRAWSVRYMVAKTSKWLPSRKVLISPSVLGNPEWTDENFPVGLSRQQIEESPQLEEHAPVSRQYEIDYHEYYGLPFYWIGQNLGEAYPDSHGVIHPVSDSPDDETKTPDIEENHLRSVNEVTGYHIVASDGEVGHVEDFLIDDETWLLRYLVVDTRNWLPGRKVLISPRWLKSIDWESEKVFVNLDADSIKNSPEYDPSHPINRRYEKDIHEHYGRPHYWK